MVPVGSQCGCGALGSGPMRPSCAANAALALFLAVGCSKDSGVEDVSASDSKSKPGEQNSACAANRDCKKGLTCNAGRHICVECIVNSDCRASETCEAGACEPLPRCSSRSGPWQ